MIYIKLDVGIFLIGVLAVDARSHGGKKYTIFGFCPPLLNHLHFFLQRMEYSPWNKIAMPVLHLRTRADGTVTWDIKLLKVCLISPVV